MIRRDRKVLVTNNEGSFTLDEGHVDTKDMDTERARAKDTRGRGVGEKQNDAGVMISVPK